MLDFAEITINDKTRFDSFLKLHKPQISELTFTNLYMWRNFYNLRYTEINGLLCIVSVPARGTPFAFMPIGKMNADTFAEIAFSLKSYFTKNGWQMEFKRVDESELSFFNELIVTKEDMRFDPNNSDYVYLAHDLVSLKGKKYDGKRNHINRFKKEHEFEYVSINENHIDACKSIMKVWCDERSCEHHKDLYCEKIANVELLDNYEKLGCKGALIKVDGKFRSFTVGEMLNDETAVIHIEKADGKINGLYTLTNQQFCEHEWSETRYVNREQDLGVEGLRRAKLSYNPVSMIKKYSIPIK